MFFYASWIDDNNHLDFIAQSESNKHVAKQFSSNCCPNEYGCIFFYCCLAVTVDCEPEKAAGSKEEETEMVEPREDVATSSEEVALLSAIDRMRPSVAPSSSGTTVAATHLDYKIVQ